MAHSLVEKQSRRAQAVRAAFVAWADSYYTNTSLAVVADELGVSKAALYRHFRNKEDLIGAMETTYLADYRAQVLDPLRRESPGDLRRFTELCFRTFFDFFRLQPEYYVFFVAHVLRERTLAKPEYQQLLQDHEAVILRGLSPLPSELTSHGSRYMTLFAVYWLLEVYRIEDGEARGCGRFHGFDLPRGDSPKDVAERERIVQAAVDVFLNGFLRDDPLKPEAMERVERIGWISEDEMLEPDRIFSAIEEIVAEVGFEGATVERIAERIGMTKSSLYFYFKNKDAMFGEAVEREQLHLSSIMKGRFRFLESLPEKLYAVFVMTASYVINNPTQLTVINWLRYRNVDVQPPKRSLDRLENGLDFLLESMDRGEVVPPRPSLVALALFPHFLVTREVIDGSLGEKQFDEQRRSLRKLFRLFEGGAAADMNNGYGTEHSTLEDD